MAGAQPSIAAIENNYSYILPGSPNYGIAQGSLFAIFGKDLAGVSTGLQSFPLAASIAGTSLTVRVNGTITHPIPYYVTPGQIAAILPSATPAGLGIVTVTSNGLTSQPAPIQVVRTEFGIDTLYGAGYGPAVAQHADGQVLGPANSAVPGETIVLWGSGVGPDPDNNEFTYPQKQNNLTNLPMEVDIGGIPAAIGYRGRSPYPGVDQLNVVVPPNVAPGCWVSVVVWTENYISNFATIPVANASTCSDRSTGYTGAQLQALLSKPLVNIGSVEIGNSPSLMPSAANITSNFNAYTPSQFIESVVFPVIFNNLYLQTSDPEFAVALTAVSIGSCVAEQAPPTYTRPAALDAGSFVLPEQVGTSSSAIVVQTNNELGGKQVGPFTAQATIPFAFSSSDSSSNWLQGVTVTWSGAPPDSFVQIFGVSSSNGLYTSFTCSAPANAGTFSVPSVVLRAMAPFGYLEADGETNPYFLAVTNYTYPQAFAAKGIDFGTIYGFETVQATSE
jgi:uncharacterized protein (TIGR03437 family)